MRCAEVLDEPIGVAVATGDLALGRNGEATHHRVPEIARVDLVVLPLLLRPHVDAAIIEEQTTTPPRLATQVALAGGPPNLVVHPEDLAAKSELRMLDATRRKLRAPEVVYEGPVV